MSCTLNDWDLMAQMTDCTRQACLFSRAIDSDKVMYDFSGGRGSTRLLHYFIFLKSPLHFGMLRATGESGRTDNRHQMRQRGGDTEQVARAGIHYRPA